MSRLEELIQQLCPDGVEWKKLIDISNILYGFPFDSSLFSDDCNYIPLIRIRDVKPAHASTYYTGDYDIAYIIKKGDILVGMDGNFNLEKWDDRDGLLNQRVCKIYTKNEQTVINGYLYHLLKPLFKKIEEDIKGGTVKHLSAQIINKIEIPLPPLPIQEEIVRILDKFTEVTAELKAELKARKDEYDYYRNQLLSFDASRTDVEWKPIFDIGILIRGNGLQKKDFTESGCGCIHYGQIYTYYRTATDTTKSFVDVELAATLTKVDTGDLVIACTSENIEDVCKSVAWLGSNQIVTGGHACVFKHNENPKYISYCFQTEWFFNQKRKYARGAKVIDIKTDDLGKILLPIPPLTEQQRIVDILDRFEKLTNDMSEGIPAEIEATQQMYEYYRNKLLDFEKNE